jgi:hypothetical protein
MRQLLAQAVLSVEIMGQTPCFLPVPQWAVQKVLIKTTPLLLGVRVLGAATMVVVGL